jgi:hypothetical protein
MRQESFFDDDEPEAPYQRHSDTSREAAELIEPRINTLRRKVLDYWRKVRLSTDEQAQDALEMNPSTERPRRGELFDQGYLRDSGKRALTKSGRRAVLWEITEPKADYPD